MGSGPGKTGVSPVSKASVWGAIIHIMKKMLRGILRAIKSEADDVVRPPKAEQIDVWDEIDHTRNYMWSWGFIGRRYKERRKEQVEDELGELHNGGEGGAADKG